MILIPVWVLLIEIATLEGLLLYVYLHNKSQTLGKIAGVLLYPIAYVFVTYVIVDYVSLSEARILARYAFGVLFFVMIIPFGRAVYLLRK
jgi:hypothetical protein